MLSAENTGMNKTAMIPPPSTYILVGRQEWGKWLHSMMSVGNREGKPNLAQRTSFPREERMFCEPEKQPTQRHRGLKL